MTNKRMCPDCGRNVYRDPEVGEMNFACRCGWEEGGPTDHGHLTMSERPSFPETAPVDPVRAAILAELDRAGL